MKLHVDRDLPVPLGIQVRGMIEYGIVSGELLPGERLPSVRELAESLRVAPMTIVQVYRHLRDAGLIETRHGQGTFIADRNHSGAVAQTRLREIQRRLDLLVRDALSAGLTPGEVSAMVQTLLSRRELKRSPRRILMVGMFDHATREYALAIQARLGDGFLVEPYTISEIRNNETLRAPANAIELAVTFPNRQREIAVLLPHMQVVALRFFPSEATRKALAGLDPFTRLGIVSHLAEFLSMLKAGIQQFAPHVGNLRAAIIETPEMEAVLAWCDVVVRSTGAESVLERLRPGVSVIEYRYGPDPIDIDQTLIPLLSANEAEEAHSKEQVSAIS